MNDTRLTINERDDLAKYERAIESGQRTFVEVGTALLSIRDRRLYRAEFTSFETYCLAKWSFTKTHANRLIGAAEVVSNLAPTGATPATESQARPLTGLPPDTQREVWEQARADGAKVTAERVKSLVMRAMATLPAVEPDRQPTREDVQEGERRVREAAEEDAYRDAVDAALRLADRLARRLADLRPADRKRVVARVTG